MPCCTDFSYKQHQNLLENRDDEFFTIFVQLCSNFHSVQIFFRGGIYKYDIRCPQMLHMFLISCSDIPPVDVYHLVLVILN